MTSRLVPWPELGHKQQLVNLHMLSLKIVLHHWGRYVVITWRGVWAFPSSIMKHKRRIHLRNKIWFLTGVFPIFPWGCPFSTCLKMEEPHKIKCIYFTHQRRSNCKVNTHKPFQRKHGASYFRDSHRRWARTHCYHQTPLQTESHLSNTGKD